MELFNEDIQEYSLEKDTKCLNTAVVIMAIYLGNEATKYTGQCDVDRVEDVYNKQKARLKKYSTTGKFVPSKITLHNLNRYILSPRTGRCLYYIMITNAEVPLHDKPDDKLMFPGHVFVVEKDVDRETSPHQVSFRLYQSYINQYNLNGAFEKNKKSFQISHDIVKRLIGELKRMNTHPDERDPQAGRWTKSTTQLWKDLTFVDSTEFEGRVFIDHVHVCFRKVPITKCTQEFEKFLNKKAADYRDKDPTKLQKIHALLTQAKQ